MQFCCLGRSERDVTHSAFSILVIFSQSQKCVRAVSVLTQPRVGSESGILTDSKARTETNFKDQARMTEITK